MSLFVSRAHYKFDTGYINGDWYIYVYTMKIWNRKKALTTTCARTHTEKRKKNALVEICATAHVTIFEGEVLTQKREQHREKI